MKALTLYVRYALRSFVRGRSRSVFGAFCVAVGIASVVGLGLVGGNFQDAVTGNAQKINRGDVSVTLDKKISPRQYNYFAGLEAQGKITDYTSRLFVDTMLKTPHGDQGNVIIGSTVAVDGKKFPFYDTITADQPAGKPLAALLANPNNAVVSHYVFDTLHLHIGDTISTVFRFGGTHVYRVSGVVPDNAEDSGFGSGLFPYFAMVDRSSLASYIRAQNTAADSVYIKTSSTAQADAAKVAIENHFGGLVSPKTVADVQKDQANSADGFNKFFRIMGLIAVVIGGIGIINTMLVAARRRTREIAVLKAIGMKGRQVILVFAIESLFLALAGTAVGIILGIFASMIVNNVTQSMAGYPIPWSLHTGPVAVGALVGIVATVLFAYLPVVRASRARPVVSLRSDVDSPERRRWFRSFVRSFRARPLATLRRGIVGIPMGVVRLPRRAGFRSFVLVLLLAALMGFLAVVYTGLVSGARAVQIGIIAGIATLVGAAVLTQIFVVVVWLVSKLPAMGRLSLRMAFRSMGTQKRRLASTLLALCIGILSLGSITIVAQNVKHELAVSLEKRQNFNVGVQSPHNPALLARINAKIKTLPGIQHRYDGAIANQLTLYSADGRTLSAIARQALDGTAGGKHKYGKDTVSQALAGTQGLAGRDLRTGTDDFTMWKGRNLGSRDVGTDHVVVSQQYAEPLSIKVGSHLVFAEGTHRVSFTVVGIVSTNEFMTFANTAGDLGYMQHEGLTAPSGSHNHLTYLRIADANLKADTLRLREAFPGVLVLNLDSFLEFTKIIDKLALLPEVIAGMALFAGAIIIANTVALAMLERRREIGIMKAVGARRRTILQFLLVENAIVGFLGAGVGVLLAMFATAQVDTQFLKISPSFDWTTVGALVLTGMVLAIGASSLTAFPASSEKPMSVLRYE